MPIYQFYCAECNQSYEYFYHMNDKRPTKCLECGSKKYARIYSDIYVAIDKNKPKTVGDLAIKNTEKMVKEGQLSKNALEFDSNKEKKKQFKSRMDKISKLNKRQQKTYINTGKLPS